ncbi:hypothetical protein ACHAWF_011745 [Thalassiosira exigua]
MGNVAIYCIQSGVSLADYAQSQRRKRIEHKRITTLIPRYIARLNDRDISITSLNLSNLGVDSQMIRLLSSPMLSGETRVQELYLEHNMIGPEGATCIARSLSRDSCLKDVSLAHNPVGSVAARAIASALEQNSSLDRLNLSFCNIDDNGIQKLTQSLKFNSTLKYINLEGNWIRSMGVYSLLKCIYDTTSMQSLRESNHTLRAFYGQRSIFEILATCNWRYSMQSCTVVNTSTKTTYKVSARVAACKILKHYVKPESEEYWECVEHMEEKLVPNVIGWLVRNADVGSLFRVVRDMPWLVEKKRVSRVPNVILDNKNQIDSFASNAEMTAIIVR